jgi:pyruvate,water dikinase
MKKYPIIKTFAEIIPSDLAIVGGKGLSLGEMKNKNFPVPDGFCITAQTYRNFVNMHHLQSKISTLSGKIHAQKDNRKIIKELQNLFTHHKINTDIKKEIISAYKNLKTQSVAVRSSATAEDLPDASFAGQQDTYLNIHSEKDLLQSVQKCWASLWRERAILYRNKEKISQEHVDIAVVVQEMVFADSAGVLFTVNPVSEKREEIVINVSWGLGEAVVSGLVSPDTLIVSKKTGNILSEEIAEKKVMTVQTESGSKEVEVKKEHQKKKVLSEKNIIDLWRLANEVEGEKKIAMDIEWGIKNDQLFLLQARPITTLSSEKETYDLMGMEWSRLMLIERYPDALTPYTAAATCEGFFESFREVNKIMGIQTQKNIPMIKIMYGRPYINVSLMNAGVVASEVKTQKNMSPDKKKTNIFTLLKILKLLFSNKKEWNKRQTPFEQFIQEISKKDFKKLSVQKLLQENHHIADETKKLLEVHSKSIVAAEISLQILQFLTKKWLHDENKEIATILISGLTGNKTLETNHALWNMAEYIKQYPKLSKVFSGEVPEDWREKIENQNGGKKLLWKIDHFLQTYGHRSPKYELAHPTWREDPKMLLGLLTHYIKNNLPNPKNGEKKQTQRREQVFQKSLEKLSFFKKILFKIVVKNAQIYFQLRENQQFYIMMQLPILREILFIFAEKFVQKKQLVQKEDIFFLKPDEITHTISYYFHLPFEKKYCVQDILKTVEERKLEMKKFQAMNPPMFLGSEEKQEKRDDKKSLKGVAASQGTATGKVRIILTPDDFHKLQPGEILVTPATTPAWTSLFGIASGLITDYGGLLSHSGVVAREYGLPAVVGTNNATEVLQNGNEVQVDGSTGRVVILS